MHVTGVQTWALPICREAEGIFVAGLDEATVGYITTSTDSEAGIGSIPNLAVDARVRGQGIGRQLIAHALSPFRSLGLSHAARKRGV